MCVAPYFCTGQLQCANEAHASPNDSRRSKLYHPGATESPAASEHSMEDHSASQGPRIVPDDAACVEEFRKTLNQSLSTNTADKGYMLINTEQYLSNRQLILRTVFTVVWKEDIIPCTQAQRGASGTKVK